jgi:hypothetical protein
MTHLRPFPPDRILGLSQLGKRGQFCKTGRPSQNATRFKMLTDIGTICYRLTMTIPPGRSQSIQRADSSISNASSTSI